MKYHYEAVPVLFNILLFFLCCIRFRMCIDMAVNLENDIQTSWIMQYTVSC